MKSFLRYIGIVWCLFGITSISVKAEIDENVNYLAKSLEQLMRSTTQPDESLYKVSMVLSEKVFEYFTGYGDESEFAQKTNVTVAYDKTSKTYKAVIAKGKSTNHPFRYDEKGDFVLRNEKDKNNIEEYRAGQFATHLHSTLKEETRDLAAAKKGSLHVVTAEWKKTKLPDELKNYVDVVALQYQAALRNEQAAFLIASDYDGIEATDGSSWPSIAAYIDDTTQGPAASLGAFPAALLRLYSQVREDKKVSTNSFDPQNPRVHMLKSDFLDTQNGYVYLNQNIDKDNANKLLENYTFSVMYHDNVAIPVMQLMTGKGYFSSFQVFRYPTDVPTGTIAQIFSAGLSLGSYRERFKNGKMVSDEGVIDQLAQRILDDIYDAAIRATAKHGRSVLYVWPMGCGVFGNKHIWVANALEKCKDLIAKSGITVKFIKWQEGKNSYESSEEYAKFTEKMLQLTKETNGSHLRVSLDDKDQVVETYQ